MRTKETCTHSSNIDVGYKDLTELPLGEPSYIRCGKVATEKCMNYEDCPNDWPAHPNVHWENMNFGNRSKIA